MLMMLSNVYHNLFEAYFKMKIFKKYVFSTLKRDTQVSKSVLQPFTCFLNSLSICVYLL